MKKMSELQTPGIDSFIASMNYSPTTHQLKNFARNLERERDEAREALAAEIKHHVETTVKWNGHHMLLTIAQCDLNKALRERDEARADSAQLADRLSGLELRTTEELARMERERDEAREENAKLRDIAENAMCLLQEQTRGYECTSDNDTCKCTASMRDSLRAELDQLKEGAK
jgi:septal ring factor EnvC (AmiA/AmiB activator)